MSETDPAYAEDQCYSKKANGPNILDDKDQLRVPQMGENRSSTTANRNIPPRTFRITHPFHPRYQQEFELVDQRCNWGEDRVYFHDAVGDLKSILTRYTSAKTQDPFVALAQGRAHFRTKDLLELIGYLNKLNEL